jgi:L-asparagine transporter-like permease
MRELILWEKIIRKVEIVNRKIPREKIFFLPTISASLPKGSKNIDADSIKLLITHPMLIAFAFSSLPIDGRARLTAEPRKGVRKAANVATIRTDLFDVLLLVISTLICNNFYNHISMSFS